MKPERENTPHRSRRPCRVAHVCVVHAAQDARVFLKECRTLADQGYEVHLVAPEPRPADSGKVTFHPVRRARPRVTSVLASLGGAFRRLAEIRPDVVHLHEPILLPLGVAAKATGTVVAIYDAHEDAPRQARSVGHNQNRPTYGWALSAAYAALVATARCLDGFVCATPEIASRFPADRRVVVRNFPKLREFASAAQLPYDQRPAHVTYAGGISRTRGIREMVLAAERLPPPLGARFRLAGRFAPATLRREVEALSGWDRTDFLGWLGREELASELGRARVGLLPFHPQPNHVRALPAKLFEYMAAGLPVIASNFPLWRRLLEEHGCGVCVNPLDPDAIAEAVRELLNDPIGAEAMGRRGREAVRSAYNWDAEAGRLLELYRRLRG